MGVSEVELQAQKTKIPEVTPIYLTTDVAEYAYMTVAMTLDYFYPSCTVTKKERSLAGPPDQEERWCAMVQT